ncbi:MAG: protein kinase [Polyangiaceae bacterium]|nr:protein kinase [Polyangiaceae bacterium]
MSADDRAAGSGFPPRIGRYRVLAPIGRGGMATVYLAQAEGIGGFRRDVALKVLHEHLQDDPELLDQFVEEANLAARIRHPNVVAVNDVARDAAGVYLVMEYVEGDSLSGLQKAAQAQGQRLPQELSLRVLSDALSGLHAAHELTDDDGSSLGLVHRDFSPQNILVGLDGVARLTDFGIAKLGARQGLTRTGVIKGKVRYMSPEQVRGEPLDRRSDLWAAGVIAWEAVAGQRLFESHDDMATLFEIATRPPRALSSVTRDVSGALEAVIARALAHDRGERFQTAAELRAALLAAAPAAELQVVAAQVRELTRERTDTHRRLARDPALEARAAPSAPTAGDSRDATLTTSASPAPLRRGRPGRALPVVGAAAVVVLGLASHAWWTRTNPRPSAAPVASPGVAAPTPVAGSLEPPPGAPVEASASAAPDASAPKQRAAPRATARKPPAPRPPASGPSILAPWPKR